MFVPSDLLTGICIVKLKTPLEAANLAASKPKLQICSLARLPTKGARALEQRLRSRLLSETARTLPWPKGRGA